MAGGRVRRDEEEDDADGASSRELFVSVMLALFLIPIYNELK